VAGEADFRLVYALIRISENLGVEQAKPFDQKDIKLIEAYEVSQRELRDEVIRRLIDG
jgi:hypothetical protein